MALTYYLNIQDVYQKKSTYYPLPLAENPVAVSLVVTLCPDPLSYPLPFPKSQSIHFQGQVKA